MPMLCNRVADVRRAVWNVTRFVMPAAVQNSRMLFVTFGLSLKYRSSIPFPMLYFNRMRSPLPPKMRDNGISTTYPVLIVLRYNQRSPSMIRTSCGVRARTSEIRRPV